MSIEVKWPPFIEEIIRQVKSNGPHQQAPSQAAPVADRPVLCDEDAISSLLAVQTKTLQAWRHRGGGPPFIKVGRLVRYRLVDVEAWIAKRTYNQTKKGVWP